MIAAMLLYGCGASNETIETDNLTISQYKGLVISDIVPDEVTDEEVEAEMLNIVSEHQIRSEVTDRPAQEGDWVTIDFTGLIDGIAFEGGTFSDYELQIGSNYFIDGFEENLIGHYAGEQIEFDLAFPDPYYLDESKSGVVAHWIVMIKAIYSMETPILDDDLVKNELAIDGVNTVEEFRQYTRKQLEDRAKAEADEARSQEAWEAVFNNTVMKVYPEDQIREYEDNTMLAYQSYAEAAGQTLEEYAAGMGTSVEELQKELESAAQNVVAQNLIIHAIAEKENLQVDDAYYQEQRDPFATEYGFDSADEMESLYDSNEIRTAMEQERVLDFLVENAETNGEDSGNKLFSRKNWPYFIGALAALIVLVLLVYLIQHLNKLKKQRQEKNAEQEDPNMTILEIEDDEEYIPTKFDTQVVVTREDYEVNSYDPGRDE